MIEVMTKPNPEDFDLGALPSEYRKAVEALLERSARVDELEKLTACQTDQIADQKDQIARLQHLIAELRHVRRQPFCPVATTKLAGFCRCL